MKEKKIGVPQGISIFFEWDYCLKQFDTAKQKIY